jgi:hypothetical protein
LPLYPNKEGTGDFVGTPSLDLRVMLHILTATPAAVDHVYFVHIAPAADMCRAIGQQFHVPRQHELDRTVDAAVALWKRSASLLCHMGERCTKGLAGRGIREVDVGELTFTDFDLVKNGTIGYHWNSSSRFEGLLPGLMVLCLAARP